MWLLDGLAEERIAQATREGQFEHLPGAGRPLDLDIDPLIPEEERAALRVLKNAGLVPPEIEHLRECGQLQSLLVQLDDGSEARHQALKRLRLLEMRLRAEGLELALDADYAERVVERLGNNLR